MRGRFVCALFLGKNQANQTNKREKAHLREAVLDVLTVREGAALAAEEQLVEELHIDEGEQLHEELLLQERRHKVAGQLTAQVVERGQQALPRRHGRLAIGRRGGTVTASAARAARPWCVDALLHTVCRGTRQHCFTASTCIEHSVQIEKKALRRTK